MATVEVDDSDVDDATKVILRLPSDFSATERTDLGLEVLADIERSLREGEAYDALEELRQQLNLNRVIEATKQRDFRGTNATTRFQSVRHEGRRLKDFWVAEYRRVRLILISLGLSTTDETFPELTGDKDLWRRSTTNPKAGEGMQQEGWIWRVGIGKDSLGNNISDGTLLSYNYTEIMC